MSVKLLMSWDILPGKEQTYFEFAMKTFAPELMKMGWQPTEAWYTLYGEGPQIMTAGVTERYGRFGEAGSPTALIAGWRTPEPWQPMP